MNNPTDIKRYVLIVDVIESRMRNDEERFDLQRRLSLFSNFINQSYKEDIAKGMGLTFASGDSMQCLFKNPLAALRAFYLLTILCGSDKLRGALGIGTINEYIYKERIQVFSGYGSNGMDGLAYHQAREGMDRIHSKNPEFIIKSGGASPKEGRINGHISDLVNLFIKLFGDLSTTQIKAYSLWTLLFPDNRFGLTKESLSTFFNSIKKKHFYSLDKESWLSEPIITEICSQHLGDLGCLSIKPSDKDALLGKILGCTRQNISNIKTAGRFTDLDRLIDASLYFLKGQ